jgi:HTH-type transcriptional regulator / antitoxin HigA
MKTDRSIHSDLAIPPGEYLEEVIEALGMSKTDLARRMGRPASKLSHIFNGTKAITPETSLQLELVTGVPAHVWNGLEAEYQLARARAEARDNEAALKLESSLVSKYRYADLARAGAVQATRSWKDKVAELRRFFGVASLAIVPDLDGYTPAFRLGRGQAGVSPHALAAWLRMGELEARSIDCAPYDSVALERLIEELRVLTGRAHDAAVAELRSLLAGTGVALVLSRHLPGTRAHGATFWPARGKAVLMITTRGAYEDIFWFSLFHELCHVLRHGRNSTFIEGIDGVDALQQREQEADRFARDVLIPPRRFKLFMDRGDLSATAVRAFAADIGVDAGIVVGRLQHEHAIGYSMHNALRRRCGREGPVNG